MSKMVTISLKEKDLNRFVDLVNAIVDGASEPTVVNSGCCGKGKCATKQPPILFDGSGAAECFGTGRNRLYSFLRAAGAFDNTNTPTGFTDKQVVAAEGEFPSRRRIKYLFTEAGLDAVQSLIDHNAVLWREITNPQDEDEE